MDPSFYRAKLVAHPFFMEVEYDYYQQQIDVLRWAVNMGRTDVKRCNINVGVVYRSNVERPSDCIISCLFFPYM
jgi:hypothetical protein